MFDFLTGPRKWCVFFFLLSCHIFFFQIYPNFVYTNSLTRLLLVSAIVDDHTVQIDSAIRRYGDTQDKSGYAGHFYADKAIGTSMLGIPLYALLRAFPVGWSPSVLLFLLRTVCVTLPALLLLQPLTKYWIRVCNDRKLATVLAFVMVFGTGAFTYSVLYISHYLAGVFLFLSFYYIHRFGNDTNPGRRLLVWSGIFSGAAILTEYPCVFPVGVIFLYLLVVLRRKQDAVWYVLGVLPFPLFVLYYNYLIFGTPFDVTYRHQTDPYHIEEHAQGFIGLGLPRPEAFVGLLISKWRGLLFFSPIFLFAVPGFFFFFREKGYRRDAGLFAGVAGTLVLFYCSMSNWDGGWALGPRYLTPIVPFLMTAVLFFFKQNEIRNRPRMQFLLWFFGLLSIVYITVGTITFPYPPREIENPFYTLHLELFLSGAYSINLVSFLPSVGPAVVFYTLLLMTWVITTAPAGEIRLPSFRVVRKVLAAPVAVLLVLIAGYQLRAPLTAVDYYARGSIYLYLGKYQESQRELEAAARSKPDDRLKFLISRRFSQLTEYLSSR